MAGQVVAVASGKGGVGKTTTVLNVGVVLRRADHTVALVDADLGMANLGPMLGVAGDRTLHDVLAGTATLEESLVEEAPGFAVLAGSESLTDYPDADPENLGAVLESLADSYDFVLVDTGAGMSHEDVLPLGLADTVVLVATPDPAAIGDTRKTAELAGLAEGDVAGLVVTKADANTDAAAVAAEVGVDLLGVIPFDPAVRESTAAGRPLEAVDPETPAAVAYRELAGVLADGGPDPSSGAEAVEAAPDPDDLVAESAAAAAEEGDSDDDGTPADAAGAPEEPAADDASAVEEAEAVSGNADDATEAEEPETAAGSDAADTEAVDEVAAADDEEAEATADDEADEAGDEDEEEEDYLAEWEDDEPESSGGFLSKLWPF